MRIIAAGSYCREASRELPPLKSLAQEATGSALRRVGRFVQLALVGAGRCVNGRTLPEDTATYFTSGRGDLETTVDVLVEMCVHGRPPSPFAFINTVGNSACFHVAQCFGVRGRSQFVTSRYAPLEAALRLAALDLADGSVGTALVGSTDVCTAPLGGHRERIGVAADAPVGEASHWFLLTTRDGSDLPLGALRTARSFTDDASLREHLKRHPVDPAGAAIAAGQHLGRERLEFFREATGIRLDYDYRSGLPWYDSQTGAGIHRFLTDPVAERLVHVDGDPSGRCTLLVIDAIRRSAIAPTPPPRDRRSA